MTTPISSGWQRLVASGVVGVSGQPLLVSAYCFESDTTAGIPYFLNGTTAAGTQVFRGGGGAVSSSSPIIAVGQLPTAFQNGMYVSFDAHTTSVTVFYTQA